MNQCYMNIKKHDGSLPIIGVNTFTDPDAETLSADNADAFDMDVTRSDETEKRMVIERNTCLPSRTF